MDIIKTPQRQ